MTVNAGTYWHRVTGKRYEVLFTTQSRIAGINQPLVIFTNGSPNGIRRYACTLETFRSDYARVRPTRVAALGYRQEQILQLLRSGPANSRAICDSLGTTVRNINASLSSLYRTGLVTRAPQVRNTAGKRSMLYSLKTPDEPVV